MSGPVTIRIQEDDFDVAREIAGLTGGRTDIGRGRELLGHLPQRRGQRQDCGAHTRTLS
ncbi:hypothetical protein ACVWXO_003948 [Bradyrhizobium sp. LM2.7]